MKVIVEKVRKVKVSALLPGTADFYSRSLTEAEADSLVAMFPGTSEKYETFRFVLYATNNMPIAFSRDFTSLGACSAWAKLLANGVGADLELPCVS